MAFSRITHVYAGVNVFTVNFPLGYISQSQVTARVNNEVDGLGDPVYRTITWLTEGTISISGTLTLGDEVELERTQDKTELQNNYADGSPITEANLDASFKQSIYLVHEVLDGRFDALSANLSMGTNRITNMGDAVDATDAVTLQQLEDYTGDAPGYAAAAAASATAALGYQTGAQAAETNAIAQALVALGYANDANTAKLAAEAAASGMKWRPNVRAATAAALPACTYANGASGVGATLTGNSNGALAAVDGVTLVSNDLVLVKNQVSTLQNGVYKLTQVGTAGTPFILTRETDADTWTELVSQVRVVQEGTVNADENQTTIWICTVNSGGTMGTTAVSWANITFTIADGSLTYVKLASSAIGSAADLVAGTASKLVNAAEFKAANKVLQVVYATPVTAADSSTTVLPLDSTIPQNTEGKQLITATITPKSASSKLLVEVDVSLGSNSGNGWAGAIFRDSTANAVSACGGPISATVPGSARCVAYEDSGSTAATTFAFRYGPALGAGTAYANSLGGTHFGGKQATTMRITEILP